MQLILKTFCSSYVIFGVTACGHLANGASTNVASFFVSRESDDGLTVRFADSLEASLVRRKLKVVRSESEMEEFSVEILDNIEWDEINNRTKISYRVKLTHLKSKRSAELNGDCWEHRLKLCTKNLAAKLEQSSNDLR